MSKENEIFGYTGNILHVNLTDGTFEVEHPDELFYRHYLGGAGLIAYYLLKYVPKGADPLGPDNILVFAGGMITGVPLAGAGRSAVGGKSPISGGFGEADVGGFMGAEMRHAGFDAIICHGISEKPVYLWIKDGEYELRSAEKLWGMTTEDTQNAIRDEVGVKNARTALIGPAGEKLVVQACVINDLKHAAGRTGMGAVMGSKRLKGIAVSGKQRIPLADPEGLRAMSKMMAETWKDKAYGMHELGTAGGINGLHARGVLPTRNFQDGQFDGHEDISGEAMRDTILTDRGGCFACPVRCKRVVTVSDDEYQVDPIYGGPEYETIGAFGSNCGVSDLRAVSKANEICNAYSMDTIATGMAVSFAMECYENGLLTKEQTGGLDLKFGNAEAMVALTQMIADREGLGDLLAKGTDQAAKEIGNGADFYAINVKGGAYPMHECRSRHGQALGYAVSPTGADHMHNFWDEGMSRNPLGENYLGWGVFTPTEAVDMNSDKVNAYALTVMGKWVGNSIGMCDFLPYSTDERLEMITAITGWNYSNYELLKTGKRILTMSKLFNLREGIGRDEDTLPKRMQFPHVSGSVTEKPVMPEELDFAVTEYYGVMGWDQQSGKPLDVTLNSLDLTWADD